MNQPIKFRAWSVEHKKMLPVHDAKFVNGEMIGAKGVGWDDTVAVMQFTGLLDKNGKEIYEGDLLKISMQGDVQTSPFVVENLWDLHVGMENGDPYLRIDDTGEVIGNIYENPELV